MGLVWMEQEVLVYWKSFRRLFTFLEREFQQINRECFQGKLPMPQFQLKNLRYAHDPLSGGFIGAQFIPASPHAEAQISFFPFVLLNKKDTQTALAHEMVHHWEWLHRPVKPLTLMPPTIGQMIRKNIPAQVQQYGWRLSHSAQYIEMAERVAQSLELPLQDFLFSRLPAVLPRVTFRP